MTNEACQFGGDLGTCKFGVMVFISGTKKELLTEQMVVFREAYCTPCLEVKKLRVLKDIRQELTWTREERQGE